MVITGIIRPPPDIRVVADRTAMFVAKNGRAFEARILGSAKGKTPKFAFLQTSSPFHAYYEDRIRHFESGGGTESDEKKKKAEEEEKKAEETEEAGAETADASKQKPAKDKVTKQKASVMDPVAKALLRQRNFITDHLKKVQEKRQAASANESGSGGNGEASEKDDANGNGNGNSNTNTNGNANSASLPMPMPVPPTPLDAVQVVAPYHLTPTQIETIQLVAQFVAMDGKGGSFLPALVNREWSNPDFAFCQPRNIHFAYFSALVDAYRKIISDFSSSAAAAEQKTAPEAENSSPPSREPTSGAATPSMEEVEKALNDAAYRTEYERELEQRRQNQQQNSGGAMEEGEIANAIDWHDFVVVETIDFPIEERVDVGLSMLPATTATTTAISAGRGAGTQAAAAGSNDADMEESSSDDDGEDDDADGNIRVVPSYTPRVVGTFDPSTARAVDPLTGKSVSVADMPEHMRIQLLDPKWAEERKKFQDKQKDSNLVGGDAVVANIARLAAAKSASGGGSSGYPATAKAQAYGGSGGSGGSSNHNKNNTSNEKHAVGPAASGSAPGAIGPATGRLDARHPTGPQQQAPKRPYGAPTTTHADGTSRAESPASKRPRTTATGGSASASASSSAPAPQHKVTVAPPVVTRAPPVGAEAPAPSMQQPRNDDAQPSAADPPPPPPPEGEKKPQEKKLLPADEFIASLGGGNDPVVELQIRIPNDSSQQNWNFFGQTLTLTGVDVRSIVKDVKGLLSKTHLNGMPPNKIQLKATDAAGKFLNNNTSLAALNIGPTALLELRTKQRGGRK